MRWLVFVALLPLFFAPPALAQDDEDEEIDSCQSWPNVPVNIVTVFSEPKYDFDKNMAAIQSIASDRGHSLPEGIALGVARYEPVLNFNVPTVVEDMPLGITCAYIKHVDVAFGYEDLTVLIAHEVPQGSCGFEEILKHEQKHVEVAHELLHKYAPIISEKLAEHLKVYGMSQASNPDYAQQYLSDKLHDAVGDIVMQMENENIERQQQIDTPAEYERLGTVCNGELATITQQYMTKK